MGTTLLAVTDTTSTAPATPTPTGLPRVLMPSTRGPPSSLPSLPLPWSVAVSSVLAFLAPMTRSTTVEGTTRGRLSPAMPLLLPTTPLVDTATTSTLPATPTLTGPPRVSTRGRLSPAMPLPLPTTPLAAMATTSTAPATPTPTGPPRVSTRGRLPAIATSPSTALTAMATTARAPSTASRSTATTLMSTRTATVTKAL